MEVSGIAKQREGEAQEGEAADAKSFGGQVLRGEVEEAVELLGAGGPLGGGHGGGELLSLGRQTPA